MTQSVVESTKWYFRHPTSTEFHNGGSCRPISLFSTAKQRLGISPSPQTIANMVLAPLFHTSTRSKVRVSAQWPVRQLLSFFLPRLLSLFSLNTPSGGISKKTMGHFTPYTCLTPLVKDDSSPQDFFADLLHRDLVTNRKDKINKQIMMPKMMPAVFSSLTFLS